MHRRLFMVVFVIVLLQISLFSTKAFCFDDNAHRNITRLVFDKAGIAERLGVDLGLARDIILAASIAPDYVEVGVRNEGHFSSRESDYLQPIWPFIIEALESNGIMDKKLAGDWVEFHFNNAVAYFRRGDRIKSLEELGMALHYMQDLCCPVHVKGFFIHENSTHIVWPPLTTTANGKWSPNTYHLAYEKKMDEKSPDFMTRIFMAEPQDPDFIFADITEIVSKADAVGLKPILESTPMRTRVSRGDGELEPTIDVFAEAYKRSYGVVYLFFKEVGIDISA